MCLPRSGANFPLQERRVPFARAQGDPVFYRGLCRDAERESKTDGSTQFLDEIAMRFGQSISSGCSSPMIFWNASFRGCVVSVNACVIYRRRIGRQPELQLMKRRRVGVLLFIPFGFPFSHGPHNTQSKQSSSRENQSAREEYRRYKPAPKLSPAAAQWVDSTLRKMTLTKKSGR